MKYMKLGTKPDTFYTEEATSCRTVLSDVQPDIVIQINNTKYLLHKFPLLLKCGLLQRLCSYADSSTSNMMSSTSSHPIILNNFPADEDSFELCAKFCYNISITLSAQNFPSAFSAANFLQMTDSVSQPNLLPKLHTFFLSFILPNWKDSVTALASIEYSSDSDQNIKILTRQLIDSIVSKILTHPSQVTWSFTYSRHPGRSVPKDWWTEDIADLHIAHFRSVIFAIRSASKSLPPALVGEALHVYAVKNLPDPEESRVSSSSTLRKERRVLEVIVSMIPAETGAVSCGFLMRLLKIAVAIEASASVKAELVRRAGRQLDEISSSSDLVFFRHDENESRRIYEVGFVEAMVESFLELGRRNNIGRVAQVFDDYLGLIAKRDKELKLEKLVQLVKLMPEFAREDHNGLYRAIDTFLQEHPDLSKPERKQLCQLINCHKLSPEVRSHAIANDQLPLRTLVQLLFIEQKKASGCGAGIPPNRPSTGVSSVLETNNQARVSIERSGERQQHHQHRREPRDQERVRLSSNYTMAGKEEGSRNMPENKLKVYEAKEENRKHA